MTFWKQFGGIVRAELTSAEPERALSAISAAGIALEDIRPKEVLTLEFLVDRADFPALEALCRKRGDTLRILERRGWFYTGRNLGKRKLLVGGIGLLLALTVFLPTRVLFFRVEGNRTVPSERILSEAETCGLSFGASRRAIRSEKMKNALLDAIPALEWAGINTRGCTAVISVRERANSKPPAETHPVGNIVAGMDGYVLSVVVTRGSGQVEPGQAVKRGDVLISGYTDCGICIQATQAEGEITAQTRRQLETVTPAEYLKKGKQTVSRHVYSLRLGKKRIFFWKDSGILEGSCDRIQKEYPLTLPGQFRLPVCLRVDTYIYRETSPEKLPLREAAGLLRDASARYLTMQMIGGQVRKRREPVTREEGAYRLRGSYLCTEMIGRLKLEGNGDTNGQASGQSRERGTG